MSTINTPFSAAIDRRQAMSALAAAAGVGTLFAPGISRAGKATKTATLAANLPTGDPAFNVRTLGRLQGDVSGRVIYSFSQGQVFGLVPGDGPALADYGRLMYRTDGCAVRMSRLRADGAVEERSRNWMFYKDAESGAYLSEFRNPYTNESLPVPTFRGGISGGIMTTNGPQISASFTMESTVFNRPLLLDWRFLGDQAWIHRHAFTRWKEGSTGFYKTEMTLDCWVCKLADLANEKLTMVPSLYSWTSQTEWQSWLKMRGKPGAMLWRNESVKLTSVSDLPAEFVAQSEKIMPGKLTEPLTWA